MSDNLSNTQASKYIKRLNLQNSAFLRQEKKKSEMGKQTKRELEYMNDDILKSIH